MDTEFIIQIYGLLTEYLSPMVPWAIGLVAGLISLIKKKDILNTYKEYYWLMALGVSLVLGGVVTFMDSWLWSMFLFNSLFIYGAEIVLIFGLAKPAWKNVKLVVEKIKPILKYIKK